MSLKLPQNFENDIQGKDTALVPVVRIGISANQDIEPFYISTNNYTFPSTGNSAIPILLNIPSIKESIDIEKRNYKISSINIDISNFPHEGKRFSDIVGERSLVNYLCSVQWVSPSANKFSTIFKHQCLQCKDIPF